MRQNAPAGVLQRVVGTPRVEIHEADGNVVGKAARQFQGEMELVLKRSNGTFVVLCAAAHVVEMSLQCELAGVKRFVFVNVDLEWILRAGKACGTSEEQ